MGENNTTGITAEEKIQSTWRVAKSATRLMIVDENEKLIAFMPISDKDRTIAEHICEIHNDSL